MQQSTLAKPVAVMSKAGKAGHITSEAGFQSLPVSSRWMHCEWQTSCLFARRLDGAMHQICAIQIERLEHF